MRIRQIWDDLRSSLWFRPSLWVIGLTILAVVLLGAEHRLSEVEASLNLPWFFLTGADGARTMLGAVGTAMLTVTTLAFSIMMVAVIQSANAYSPRILRQYLSDTANQHVLGILISTFLFSLLVLRAVRATDEATFVPSLAVNVALLLSLLSIGAFIYFIHHVAHSIQVGNIIQLILHETESLVEEIFPSTIGEPWTGQQPPTLPDTPSAVVHAEYNGYIQFIELSDLLDYAIAADGVIHLHRTVGDYVVPGNPVVTMWPAEALDDDMRHSLHQTIHVGKERTLVQDLAYGVRQLSDIGIRALSPGINDPSTAAHCIDALATVLAKVVQRGTVSPYRCDEDGTVRVIAYGPTFETLLDLAFDQIRHYGAGDVAILTRLLEVYGEIGYTATQPDHRAALWQHVRVLMETADRHIQIPRDRIRLNRDCTSTATILNRDVEPVLLSV